MWRLPKTNVFLYALLAVLFLYYKRSSTATLLQVRRVIHENKRIVISGISLPLDVDHERLEASSPLPIAGSGIVNKPPDVLPSPPEGMGEQEVNSSGQEDYNGVSIFPKNDSDSSIGPVPTDDDISGREPRLGGEPLDADVYLNFDKDLGKGNDALDASAEEAELTENHGAPKPANPPFVILQTPENALSILTSAEPDDELEIIGSYVDPSHQPARASAVVIQDDFADRDEEELSGMYILEPGADGPLTTSTLPSSAGIEGISGPPAITSLPKPSPTVVPTSFELPVTQPAGTSSTIEPSTLNEPTADNLPAQRSPETDIILQNDSSDAAAEESEVPSSEADERDVWVEIPLVLSNLSENGFLASIDSRIRAYAAQVTGTSGSSWRLVDVSEGSADTSTRLSIKSWLVIYHALLPGRTMEIVAILESRIGAGILDEYLRKNTNETSITARIAAEPTVNVKAGEEVAFGDAQVGSVENATEAPVEEDEGTEKPNSDSSSEKGSEGRLPIILGTVFGAATLLVAAFGGIVYYKNGARNQGHLLDGVPGAPTTITSFSSGADSIVHETEAPERPRNIYALRNQSMILDWGMNLPQPAENAKSVSKRRVMPNSFQSLEVPRSDIDDLKGEF